MWIGSIDVVPAPAAVRDGVAAPGNGAPQPSPQLASVEPASPPSAEAVRQAVVKANQALRSMSQSVEFEYDAAANVTVVRLVDTQDNQVLRQIPSAEMLEIARALDEMHAKLLRSQA